MAYLKSTIDNIKTSSKKLNGIVSDKVGNYQ
jgi:hypothetical protein